MTSSPLPTTRAARLPSSRSLPGPVARIRPRCGFCFAESGNRMPPAVFSSASRGSTTTRSSRGRTLMSLLMSYPFDEDCFVIMLPKVLSPRFGVPHLGARECLLHHAGHAAHSAHASHAAAHAAHSTHAFVTVVVMVAARFLFLGNVGDNGFGGQEQASDAGAVLQGAARHFHGIDDAGFAQVGILA